MRVKIERKSCSDCPEEAPALTFPESNKPLRFTVIEDQSQEELVITIMPSDDQVVLSHDLAPQHHISRTDWLS
jgi:hypothetical protein